MFRPLYKAIFRWVFLKLVLVTLHKHYTDRCGPVVIFVYLFVSDSECIASNGRTIVNWKEYRRKWSWLNLRYSFAIFRELLGKATYDLTRDSRCPYRDSSLASPKHKSETLPLEPFCTVREISVAGYPNWGFVREYMGFLGPSRQIL
jgi:hypothetical protein